MWNRYVYRAGSESVGDATAEIDRGRRYDGHRKAEQQSNVMKDADEN